MDAVFTKGEIGLACNRFSPHADILDVGGRAEFRPRRLVSADAAGSRATYDL